MAAILPQAESFLLTGNTDTACLFIHGFTASPSEVYPLARLIYDLNGFTVSGPLLPGHGTSPMDLNCTSWVDWFGRVEEEIRYLQKKHERVFVVGLSMGGLLGLHAAQSCDRLQGVIAINPPIFTHSPVLMALAPLLSFILPYYPKPLDPGNPQLKEKGRFAYPVYPVRALMSMQCLRKIVVKELPALNIPLLLIQSSADESIDPKGVQFIKDKAVQSSVRLIELKNSGHIATMGPEIELIAAEMAEFIAKLK